MVLEKVAEQYPQLYLDPDRDAVEEYKKIMTKGKQPERKNLSHYIGDPRDSYEEKDTMSGRIGVVTLYNRKDFEIFARNMMASKKGPDAEIPPSQGSAIFVTFNWGRINAHKEEFLRREEEAGVEPPDWISEFKRFTSVKSNYIDHLILLSYGPYSNISAERIGLSETEWNDKSKVIREYHEITHFICRRRYPEQVSAIWDEVVADSIGVYAAFGRFDKEFIKLFLGITDSGYTGGRLENYVEDSEKLDELSEKICKVLDVFEGIINNEKPDDAFLLIPELEQQQSILWDQ